MLSEAQKDTMTILNLKQADLSEIVFTPPESDEFARREKMERAVRPFGKL
jgi:hypothetical protein